MNEFELASSFMNILVYDQPTIRFFITKK